jgi:hypothetical protein
MHPVTTNTTNEMNISTPPFVPSHSNPNLASSNLYQSPSLSLNDTNPNNRFSFPDLASSSSSNSLNYIDLLRTWNYHQFLTPTLKADHVSDDSSSDYHPRNGSFHQYCPRLSQNPPYQQIDDEILLRKFRHDTLVHLDVGESKNIQELTTNDFLTSAKRSDQYSRLNDLFIIEIIYKFLCFSILARIDYIGSVDKSTGKVELRFYIGNIEKMVIDLLYKNLQIIYFLFYRLHILFYKKCHFLFIKIHVGHQYHLNIHIVYVG